MLIQDHRVYEGVLREMGEGEVVQGTGGGTRTTVVVTEYTAHVHTRELRSSDAHDQKGFIKRSYIDIGDTRIRSVMLIPFWDQLLTEAVGQDVALSVLGPEPNSPKRHTVVAFRTPREGIVRPSRKVLAFGTLVKTLKYWIAAPFLALFVAFVGAILGKFVEPLFWLGLVAAAVVCVTWIVLPFFAARRTFKAAAALSPRFAGGGVSQTQV